LTFDLEINWGLPHSHMKYHYKHRALISLIDHAKDSEDEMKKMLKIFTISL
jgi:hypothetical protein